jgi:aldehyde dehydrogenase (NAD+)
MSAATEPIALRHLVGGEPTGTPTTPREDPARPGTVVSLVAAGELSDMRDAIAAAAAAFPAWRDTPAQARAAILDRAADLLAARVAEVASDLCAEEGKTLAEARGEVQRASDILRFHAATAWMPNGETFPSATPGTLVFTAREPLGVVGLITPWNFPIAIPAWKLAPALAAGNTVVLKPAEWTPASAHHLVSCLVEAGLPAGVVNVVHGRGETVGSALVADERVSAVSFTGSVAVGKAIRSQLAERDARLQLEMGGKNATVVLADADPARAAGLVAASAFGLTGQACTATSRVIVERSAAERLVEALRAESRSWAPGDGRADGVRMGPVVSPEQLRQDLEHVDAARSEGAEVVTGASSDGQFLEPTIFAGVRPEMRIAREEVFGPVVAVIEVDDLDEAIAVTNDSSFGLTAGIVTHDVGAALRFAREAAVGVVKVNRPTTGLDLNVPFGGIKDSSTATFREQGPRAGDFYSRERSIYLGS